MRNAIERTGYKQEVLKLAAGGIPREDIVEKLNEWDQGRSGIKFTVKMLDGFLERTLGGGISRALELQRTRDAMDISATARGAMELFKGQMETANRNGDHRLLKLASEQLVSWWDRTAELQGLVGKQANVALEVNIGNDRREVDALLRAIKEVFIDKPEEWERVNSLARYYADNATSKGVVDVAARGDNG